MSKLYFELSNNSMNWGREAKEAIENQKYLIVHPSHILSLLEAGEYAELKRSYFQEMMKTLDRLREQVENSLKMETVNE